MRKTICERDFLRAFEDMNRKENFSREGLIALFDYLEQFEKDCGQEVELDVIALCCEYSEYENLAEFQKDYGTEYESMRDIEEATQVIPIDDERFIIQQF